MNKLEILTQARALIADPKHWTTFALARNGDGTHISPNHPEATQFCAVGAIDHVAGDQNWGAIQHLTECANTLYAIGIAGVNDSHTYGHEAVLHAYDMAIKETKAGVYDDQSFRP